MYIRSLSGLVERKDGVAIVFPRAERDRIENHTGPGRTASSVFPPRPDLQTYLGYVLTLLWTRFSMPYCTLPRFVSAQRWAQVRTLRMAAILVIVSVVVDGVVVDGLYPVLA